MTKDKQLKDKTIKIKGKDYVMVKDRLIYFNDTYPNGSITTELVSDPTSSLKRSGLAVGAFWVIS